MAQFAATGPSAAVGTEVGGDVMRDVAQTFANASISLDDEDDLDDASDDTAEKVAAVARAFGADREELYEEAFVDHDVHVGKAVSKRERDETGQRRSTLVYGEIRFDSFALALEKVKNRYGLPGVGHTGPEGLMQQPGGIFYDIGSGTGKPTVAAAIAHPFAKAYGIEILTGLYEESVLVKQKWDLFIAEKAGRTSTEVLFVNGDITNFEDHDWSDGDVLFANSTCFDESLMAAVAEKARFLKKGAIFVTLTKRIPGKDFQTLESELHQMSWGGATVYIQQKQTEPPSRASAVADAAVPTTA